MIYMFDWTFLLLIPPFILALWAQMKTQATFKKYSRISITRNMTGAEIAGKILTDYGVRDIRIERVNGVLTDHYDPVHKVLNLSDAVYSQNSIAAAGVAAHEAGHALQHAKGYSPIKIRNSLVPVANITSYLAIPLFFIGFLMSFPLLIKIGIFLFIGIVAFHLVTLPVEFDASSRALKVLKQSSFLNNSELEGARSVLSAAALTYVSAALMAFMQLIRLIFLARDRD